MDKHDKNTTNYTELMNFSNRLYEKGYSGNDLSSYIQQIKPAVNIGDMSNNSIINNEKYKYQLLLTIDKIKSEFRNEKLLMFFILNFLFLSSEVNLENISFM